MADFVANLARINALAEDSVGFVWRDACSLNQYVYKSAHAEIMRRRKEWFERMREAQVVLWWVRRGHRPGTAEATEKLGLLRTNGPTQEAFTFRQAFPAPDAQQ